MCLIVFFLFIIIIIIFQFSILKFSDAEFSSWSQMHRYIIMLTFSFERQQAVTSKIVPYRLCEGILRIKIIISSGQKQFLSPAECVQ